MRVRLVVPLVVLVLLAGVARTSQAQFQLYTDRAAWEAAVHGMYSEENFTDATLNPGLSVVSTVGVVDTILGVWSDRLTTTQTTTFSFSAPMMAFGGNWDLSPGGAGMGIAVELANGVTEIVPWEVPNSATGEFWGFTSPYPFKNVTLLAGTQEGSAETFYLDNMVYATIDAVVVPALSTWGLAGLAALMLLAGAFLLRRI